jgi:hypothetical protein
MNFELEPIDEGLCRALRDASRTADAVGQTATTLVSSGSASVLMSAPDGARLAINRLTVLIGDELKAMQRLMRGVPQPLPQTTIDELAAGELPRRVLVNVDVLTPMT